MKTWRIEGAFGLDQLKLRDLPDPQPGLGELLLEVSAVSLNYRDWMMVSGSYNPRQPLPLIPCSDAVGRVIAKGPGVKRWNEGDRLCPIFAPRWLGGEPSVDRIRSTLGGPLPGTLTQRIVVPQESVVSPPAHLSDEEAACLPCAGVTAWSALCTLGGVKAGDTVLIMGTGGVSLCALQLAKALGARIILTSSSDEKLAKGERLGAHETINYQRDESWGKTARELSGGGVDLVVEVGGASTLNQSLAAVRPGGTIALIGVLSGVKAPVLITPILMKQIRLQGVLVGDRDGFEALNRCLELHQIQPVVHRVYPFEEAPRAFKKLASGQHFGKVVLSVSVPVRK